MFAIQQQCISVQSFLNMPYPVMITCTVQTQKHVSKVSRAAVECHPRASSLECFQVWIMLVGAGGKEMFKNRPAEICCHHGIDTPLQISSCLGEKWCHVMKILPFINRFFKANTLLRLRSASFVEKPWQKKGIKLCKCLSEAQPSHGLLGKMEFFASQRMKQVWS